MSGSSSAGQSCEKCALLSRDSCLCYTNVNIEDSDGNIHKSMIYGNNSENYYVVDKGFKVKLLSGADELSFSTGKNSVNKFSITSSDEGKTPKINLLLVSKCCEKPDICPEGIFGPIKNQGVPVNKLYSGNIPYSNEISELTLDPFSLVLEIIQKKIPSLNSIYKTGSREYKLGVAKKHDDPSYKITYEGWGFFDRKGNGLWPLKINVYPYTEFTIGVGFGKKTIVNEKMNVEERRESQTKINQAAGHNNRSGWTRLDSKLKEQEGGFRFSGSMKIGGNEFKYEYKQAHKYLSETAKKLDSIGALGDVGKTVLNRTSAVGAKGIGYPLIRYEPQGYEINATVRAKYSNSSDLKDVGYDWELAFDAKPIYSGKIIVDLIQVLAAYYGIQDAISNLRVLLKKNPSDNSLSLVCDLFLEGGLDASFIFQKKYKEEWSINLDETGVFLKPGLNIQIRGQVSLYLVSGAFEIDGEMSAEIRMEIRTNSKKRIEIIAFHKGVKLIVKGKASGGTGRSHTLKNLDEKDTFIDGSWNIYDAMDKNNAIIVKTF